MKRFLFRIFKPLILCLLFLIKKIRRFDPSFPTYIPDVYNSRSLLLWRLKVINPLLNIDVNFKNISSEIPLSIYIPASVKDINTLPNVIEGALKYIKHPINNIYIIADKSEEIVTLCNNYGVSFIDEKDVLSYTKCAIIYRLNNEDRSGWLYQQLLKLNADKIVEDDYFLLLDADTVFIKPKVFIHDNKMILDMSEERHEVYHIVYEKILQRKTISELSFITHYMLVKKDLLKQLKEEIEFLHQKKWDEVILQNTDYSDVSGFSEYELYGNFLMDRYPKLIKREYWFNSISTSPEKPAHIKSFSMHSYLP